MAAVDYFLKIDGIDGESVDKGHEKWIEVQSWSWGETNIGSQSSGTGGGAGKVSIQDFHFTAHSSKASPQLFLACCSGKHIPKAVLYVRKAGAQSQGFEYIKLYLQDVLVSSYQMGGDSSAAASRGSSDQFSLNFDKMEFLYTVQNTGEQFDVFFDFTLPPGA